MERYARELDECFVKKCFGNGIFRVLRSDIERSTSSFAVQFIEIRKNRNNVKIKVVVERQILLRRLLILITIARVAQNPFFENSVQFAVVLQLKPTISKSIPPLCLLSLNRLRRFVIDVTISAHYIAFKSLASRIQQGDPETVIVLLSPGSA